MSNTSDRNRVRLNLVINKQLDDLLEQRAEETASSKSEILRKALTLYEVAYDAQKKGEHLGVLNSDRQVLREIVGI